MLHVSSVLIACFSIALISFIDWREILQQLLHDDTQCALGVDPSALRLPALRDLSPPRFHRKLNKLAEQEDWHGRDWLQFLVDSRFYAHDECPAALETADDSRRLARCMLRARRKEWEVAQGLLAMRVLGKFNNRSVALGIGCGHEAVVFYLAMHLQHVVSSDLYAGGGWNDREGSPAMLADPEYFNPFTHMRKQEGSANGEGGGEGQDRLQQRLSVVHMSGMDLRRYPDAHFDVVFSFSSIEHFYFLRPSGFHMAAKRSVLEMARVVKPSGVVTIATEVIVNGVGHYDWVGGVLPMRNFFLPHELMQYIVDPAASAGLYLVEPIDWTISNATSSHSVPLDRCRDHFPHILLRDRGVVWTSISLAFQKG